MGMFDIGASVFDAAFSAWSQNEQAKEANYQAQQSREWQERMANTQYQRTVQDLNAAGLSPMLAYSKGASTLPSGATASGIGSASSDFAGGVQRSEARELARQQTRVAKAQEEVNINTAQQIAEQAKKTALEVEQMPVRFYYDLAEQGSRINANTAAAANSEANAANTNQDTTIKKPDEDASKTWWKRNVSPHLGDVQKIANSAGSLLGFRNLFSKPYEESTYTINPKGQRTDTIRKGRR